MYSSLNKKNKIPSLKGLVLNGGKSHRMGEAKGDINYHGKSQKEIEANILSKYCEITFYSQAKKSEEETSYDIILDSFIDLGPYGGILSAFRKDPNSAWLSVACDLPYLDDSTINQLVNARNPSKVATCFYNPVTEFPEPLITIWEPRAYHILLDSLSQGFSSLRKILINSDIELIEMLDPNKMKNANTPEEKLQAEKLIKESQS